MVLIWKHLLLLKIGTQSTKEGVSAVVKTCRKFKNKIEEEKMWVLMKFCIILDVET